MTKDILIGDLPAYHTFPDDGSTQPGLIVIEEVWGLTGHIRNVADRFAAQGYSVLAPELLHDQPFVGKVDQSLLGDMQNPEKRDEAQKKMRELFAPIRTPEFGEKVVAMLKACVDYLEKDQNVGDKIGVVGFCFGGTFSFALSAADDRISAALPFYGQPLASDKISAVNCPILAFYGQLDHGLIESLPKLKEEMSAAGKDFEAVVYPNCGHAFFNDTNVKMYNADAAHDAWDKAVRFLAENLK